MVIGGVIVIVGAHEAYDCFTSGQCSLPSVGGPDNGTYQAKIPGAQQFANESGIPVRNVERRVERMKRPAGVPANANVRVELNGEVIDEDTGESIGNVYDEPDR